METKNRDNEVETERVLQEAADRYLASRSLPGVAIYSVLAITVIYLSGASQQRPTLFIFLAAATLGLGAVRMYWSATFARHHRHNPTLWRRLFVAGATAAAGLWGSISYFIIAEDGLHASGILSVISTVGLCAGALNAFAPSLAIQRLYPVLTLSPLLGMPLIRPEPQILGLSIMTACYLGFLWIQGGMIHRGYWQGVRDNRLLELRARELERAREVAEKASKTKSDFLANMSHEIRTPLNGVIGMTDLVLDSEITAEQREYLRFVRSSADSLLDIINDVLDFSKIEAGKLRLDPVPFRPRNLIADCLAPLEIRARQQGLAFRCEFEPGLPAALVGDPVRLRQIVLNLVGNALKFTERGSVGVRVRAEPSGGADTTLRIEVSDTGIGIAPSKQTEIFQAFSQADMSTTRRYGGTGLGLAISSNLVSMMEGRIGLHSKAGEGSTFHVSLPLRAADESDVSVETAPRSGSADADPARRPGRAASRPPLRVLVAEDNPVNSLLITRVLERAGHSVVSRTNGVEALAALEQDDFDLVLMDVQMPEMDGFDATAAIREKEARGGGHLPIVALTAHAMRGDRERCLEAGMDAYVSKPIDADQLLETLDSLARRQTAGAEP